MEADLLTEDIEAVLGKAAGMTLMLKVYRTETDPVIDLSEDLCRLIEDLENVEPSARPTAVTTAKRLRWILNTPNRVRRRRWRIASFFVVGSILLAAATTAVSARIQAGIEPDPAASGRFLTEARAAAARAVATNAWLEIEVNETAGVARVRP